MRDEEIRLPALEDDGRARTPAAELAKGGAYAAFTPTRPALPQQGFARYRPGGAEPLRYFALTSILRDLACASLDFGRVTVSTPLAKPALILSTSTLSGTRKVRRNEP